MTFREAKNGDNKGLMPGITSWTYPAISQVQGTSSATGAWPAPSLSGQVQFLRHLPL